jgi:hypothetical protein
MWRAVGLVLLAVLTAAAAPVSVLDVAALPTTNATAWANYAEFLLMNLPRAFALSSGGAYGWFGGAGTAEAAKAKALASCTAKGGNDCALYAVDLDVVWHGAAPAPRTAVPGPLKQDGGYAMVPDARYFWHGPQQAAGLYVWAHGKSPVQADERGQQPPPYLRAFNNAGYDVVRYDRDPGWDEKDHAAAWLRTTVAELRRQGWRRVIVGGQSRGAWNSLQILDTPGLADVVIAVSAADSGIDQGRQVTMGTTELYRIFSAANAPTTRVAIVQFADDPFEAFTDKRIALINERLRSRIGPLLVIDRPPGIAGHGGGNTSAFARRFALCLFRFATAPTPPASC